MIIYLYIKSVQKYQHREKVFNMYKDQNGMHCYRVWLRWNASFGKYIACKCFVKIPTKYETAERGLSLFLLAIDSLSANYKSLVVIEHGSK